VTELSGVPPLRDPVMVAAFEGWNDAGEAASGAVAHLERVWGAEAVGELDPEEYHDFQVSRPTISVAENGKRQITWPTTRLYWARPPGASRDVVILRGIEPSMRWQRFTREVLEYADQLQVGTMIMLGALLADVPHTRPVSITGLASDEALVERLGLSSASYEGPTGITGVLHSACQDAGVPSASLWASVPHYVAAAPNPKAALALVRKLEGLVGVSVDAGELETASADYERQVSLAVQSDPDVQAFVERLEQAAEQEQNSIDPTDLPSGDVIAREFQRFLRQRGPGEKG
jgi:predicted ATP-grasp superfamily ATP-dependent carboligase